MSKECPVCGNAQRNLTNKVGQWQCGVCKHIWTPDSPKTTAAVDETTPVAQPVQQPAPRQRPRENVAQQIRALHAYLQGRVPNADDAVLREMALDFHQVLADAAALGRVQDAIDSLVQII
jgi:rubredoxin